MYEIKWIYKCEFINPSSRIGPTKKAVLFPTTKNALTYERNVSTSHQPAERSTFPISFSLKTNFSFFFLSLKQLSSTHVNQATKTKKREFEVDDRIESTTHEHRFSTTYFSFVYTRDTQTFLPSKSFVVY